MQNFLTFMSIFVNFFNSYLNWQVIIFTRIFDNQLFPFYYEWLFLTKFTIFCGFQKYDFIRNILRNFTMVHIDVSIYVCTHICITEEYKHTI